jgi:hypothetical protein
MVERGESHEGFNFSLVSLTLHCFDGEQFITFHGVPSKYLAKTALAEEAVGVKVKIIGEFDPRGKL